jgi:hypothetical protein
VARGWARRERTRRIWLPWFEVRARCLSAPDAGGRNTATKSFGSTIQPMAGGPGRRGVPGGRPRQRKKGRVGSSGARVRAEKAWIGIEEFTADCCRIRGAAVSATRFATSRRPQHRRFLPQQRSLLTSAEVPLPTYSKPE